MSPQRQQTWTNESGQARVGSNVDQKLNNGVHKPGQQAIYGLPRTSSSGGQCLCPRLKGVQLITAEQKSNSARLRDMITVVSQLSQSQNTQSVTADQRHNSDG